MEEPLMHQPELVGRDSELAALNRHLAAAMAGKGSTVLISGEPGIGKTALVKEFRKHAEAEGARILSGAAMSGSAHPFQVFSKALEGVTDKPLFEEQEYTSFTEIFAVNSAGLLLAKASSEEGGLDADIFAGMLSAVQDFVRDSFGQEGGKAGLGRLEYGDMKILIEHGQHLFLTAVFSGNEHPDMKNTVTRTLKGIEESYGQLIEGWSGKMSEIAPVQEEITKLAGAKFLVRKDLEGVKLENERIRIADRVLETLAQLSGEKILVLFMEDLHWADESSLFVLNYLARNIRDRKMLFVSSCRPNESPTLDITLEKMRAEETILEMKLMKLDNVIVIDIINTTYPENDFSEDFVNSLAERCGGNPFFIIEFLKQMKLEGAIVERGGKYLIVDGIIKVPGSVEELIQSRLSGIGPEALAVAEYASCIGREFKTSVAMSIGTTSEPETALGELQSSEILNENSGTIQFCHAIYQDFIYSTLSPRWKSSHHRSIGEHYEVAYAGRTDEIVYELAKHFSRSNEFEKSVDYSIKAGEKAESAYALGQAVEFYEAALASLARKRIDSQTAVSRYWLLSRIGEAAAYGGMLDRALDALGKAIDEATTANERAEAMKRRANAFLKFGRYEEALEQIKTMSELEGVTDPLHAGNAKIMWSAALMRIGNYDLSMKLAEEGIAMLETFDSRKAEMIKTRGLSTIGICHHNRGNFDKGLEYYMRNLSINERLNDKSNIGSAYGNLAILYTDKGEYDLAVSYLEKGLKIKEEISDRQGVAAMLCMKAIVLSEKGDFDEAKEFYQRAQAISEKIGDLQGIVTVTNNVGFLHLESEDYAAARKAYERGLKAGTAIGAKRSLSYSKCGLAEVNLHMGDLGLAESFGEEAYALAKELDLKVTEYWALTILGQISAKKTDWPAAERRFAESLAGYEENNLPIEKAKAEYSYAQILAEKGELARAGELLTEAESLFAEKQMHGWAIRCRKASEGLDQ